MRGVDAADAVAHAALLHRLLDVVGDVGHREARRRSGSASRGGRSSASRRSRRARRSRSSRVRSPSASLCQEERGCGATELALTSRGALRTRSGPRPGAARARCRSSPRYTSSAAVLSQDVPSRGSARERREQPVLDRAGRLDHQLGVVSGVLALAREGGHRVVQVPCRLLDRSRPWRRCARSGRHWNASATRTVSFARSSTSSMRSESA